METIIRHQIKFLMNCVIDVKVRIGIREVTIYGIVIVKRIMQ